MSGKRQQVSGSTCLYTAGELREHALFAAVQSLPRQWFDGAVHRTILAPSLGFRSPPVKKLIWLASEAQESSHFARPDGLNQKRSHQVADVPQKGEVHDLVERCTVKVLEYYTRCLKKIILIILHTAVL